MQPWEYPLPPVLYKYFHSNRLHVLTDCHVRFSQRTVFEDDRELQPNYAGFGTAGEIWRHIIRLGLKLDPRIPANILVQLIAESPRAQALAIQVALRNMKSVNEFGVFCLTETPDCKQMWREYADDGRGFVIAFDTNHDGFGRLRAPGRIGRVSYSDEVSGTFLGTMETEGAAIFFRKRMRYAFEREWRSIRALQRLECCPGEIFLSPFDPASVCEIIIRACCPLQRELRRLSATDGRYQHVQVLVLNG